MSVLTDQVNYIDIHSGSGRVLPEGSYKPAASRVMLISFHTRLEWDMNKWGDQNCMQESSY